MVVQKGARNQPGSPEDPRSREASGRTDGRAGRQTDKPRPGDPAGEALEPRGCHLGSKRAPGSPPGVRLREQAEGALKHPVHPASPQWRSEAGSISPLTPLSIPSAELLLPLPRVRSALTPRPPLSLGEGGDTKAPASQPIRSLFLEGAGTTPPFGAGGSTNRLRDAFSGASGSCSLGVVVPEANECCKLLQKGFEVVGTSTPSGECDGPESH